MSTEVRRKRGDMITTFKILKGKVDLARSIFQVNTESSTRGNNLKLVINRTRTDCRKYFFTNSVCKDWNDLGREVIESSSVEIFKRPMIIDKIQRQEADHRAYSSIPLNSMKYP